MKENKYDDPLFFEKYSQMPRSLDGLNAAGEWHTLRSMLPKMQGMNVLDMGCGYGWHCRYAIEQGAASVVGIDLSSKMLEVAKEKNKDERIRYECCAMEDFVAPENSFDLILSSLAIHYIEDYPALIKKVHALLKESKEFIFSIEHPIFMAQGSQQWINDDQGEKLYWPVDQYFIEGKREASFLDEPVIKYHRTLETLLMTLLDTGFSILEVKEPQPSEEMLKTMEGMKDELRRPMMLLIRAKKN